MLRILRIIAVVYLGVLLVLLWFENKLLFHPYKDTDSWVPPPPGLAVEDVWLPLPDGTKVHGWWCPVPGAKGALLYAHGNAGNLSHRGQAVQKLQEGLGLSVLIVDYPGFGKSEGKVSEAGCYAAAHAAYDWLAQKVPPEQIVLYGKSLGGGVMTELAVQQPHRALVLVKTFTSVPDMAQKQFPFLPARWLVRNQFNNLARIPQCPRPIFIAHGDCDSLIPLDHSRQLLAAASEPKQFFLMPGCDHNDPAPVEFYHELAKFLRQSAPTE